MPTGAVLGGEHFDAIAGPAQPAPRLGHLGRGDGTDPLRRPAALLHPGAHPGLADRTITVGSASKELRMIGWRVGWVAGPEEIMADIGLVGLTNVVCQVGIAQQAVAAALNHPGSGADVAAATRVWQQRSTLVLDQLAGYPCVRPHGGWSLLIDTRSMGLTPGEASRRLFTRAQVAATPMDGWGPSGSRYLRLVFANEPAERLTGLRARFDTALS